MSAITDFWTDGDTGSGAKLNAKGFHGLTGAQIAAIPAALKTPGLEVWCTADGSGFALDKKYNLKTDLSSFVMAGLTEHTHISSLTGGDWLDTIVANMGRILDINKIGFRKASYWETTGSSGVVTDDSGNGWIQLSSSATSGGNATLADGNVKMDFAQRSRFQTKLKMLPSADTGTSYVGKFGVRAEAITSTNDAVNKYGFEGCSASGTTYLIYSADGTTRTTSGTTYTILNNLDSFVAIHSPGVNIQAQMGTNAVVTKTSNVPATGTTGDADLFRIGIKNSAAETKRIQFYGYRLAGYINDADWRGDHTI